MPKAGASSILVVKGVRYELAAIPAGEFQMGSTFGEPGETAETPVHPVKISALVMGKTEVTQGLWQAVMGSLTPSNNRIGENYPVAMVSWNDTQQFLRKLNQLTGGNYRLPTEAEWEYACRAGMSDDWQDDGDRYEGGIGAVAWYLNAGNITDWEPQPVGQKHPNAWGLYDMFGNVGEWCQDWYDKEYYNISNRQSLWRRVMRVPQIDPTGPVSGESRVVRGGQNYIDYNNQRFRWAYRAKMEPGSRGEGVGFRLAEKLAQPVDRKVKQEDHLGAAATMPAGTFGTTLQPAVTAGPGGGDVTVTLPGGVPLAMVRIPRGTFEMGSPATERNRGSDETLHQVTLTSDYYIGKYPVTQRQWTAVTGGDLSSYRCHGDDCPAVGMSWYDIVGSGGFIGRLNAYLTQTNQGGGGKFRLPTEAEWERAARGGTQTRFWFGDALNGDDGCGANDEAVPYVWWCGNSSIQRPVGWKAANPYGLYDMHGSVGEWVQDWYGNYPSSAQTNPAGPTSGVYRVYRGTGYRLRGSRSACRGRNVPDFRYGAVGFRLARTL